MKIANKGLLILTVGTAIITASCVGAVISPAHAADVPMIAPPPSPVVMPVEAQAPLPGGVVPAAAPVTTSSTSADLSKSASTDIAKDLAGAEDRAVDTAKAVIKKLDSTDSATLEDLNAARQAIARLQAMTEVEKKLADLEKARSERTGAKSLSSAVPASALAPPAPVALPYPTLPPMKPVEASMPMNEMPHPISSMSGTEISRIIGVDGKYAAVLKNGSDTRTVRVGDKAEGGGVVVSITPSSVQIEENGSTHTLHVKNADVVYSAMR